MTVKSVVSLAAIFAVGLGAGYMLFAPTGQTGTKQIDIGQTEDQAVVPATEQVVPDAAALDEARVREIVEAYIKENPVVIMQSVSEYQQFGQVRAMEANAESYLPWLEATENVGLIGAPDAPVKIIEFFDYQCPHCKSNYMVLHRILEEDSSVALMPKYLPILGDGSEDDMSLYAARAAEAMRLQGLFVPFHEKLINLNVRLSRETIHAVALEVGADLATLKQDITSEQVQRAIAETRAVADDIGISAAGTPGYIIGGKIMIGAAPDSYDRLKAMIEAARSAE